MVHLLRQVPDSCHYDPFGRQSAVLAQAVRLASVCKLWRRATARATRALSQLDYVQPDVEVPPHFLSTLLAELVAGRCLELVDTLLVAPNTAAFLELAAPCELVAYGAEPASAALGAVLANCSSIVRLQVVGLVLTQYPPRLQFLTVSFDPSPGREQAGAALEALQCLPQLAELSLGFNVPDDLPCSLPQLPCLRRLSVGVSVWPNTPLSSLMLLETAAARGVRTELGLSFHSEQGWQQDWESGEESEPWTLTREHTWAALAQVSLLDELRLSVGIGRAGEFAASARELQLLASVRCKQLVLHVGMQSPFTEQLVHALKPDFVVWHHASYSAAGAAVQWSVVRAQPGVYVMGHKLDGCCEGLPVHSAPWALVFERAQPHSVTGLPAGSRIESGPCGHAVWRNSAMTDDVLVSAYKSLGINTADSNIG